MSRHLFCNPVLYFVFRRELREKLLHTSEARNHKQKRRREAQRREDAEHEPIPTGLRAKSMREGVEAMFLCSSSAVVPQLAKIRSGVCESHRPDR